jgi:glycosyltransferase involved in cell wall biosynthesis
MIASIVVPTNKSCEQISDFLAGLVRAKATLQDFEFIVVFNGEQASDFYNFALSTDFSNEIHFLKLNGGNANSARNLGARAASGKNVLFLDDDCILKDGSELKNLIDVFDKQEKLIGVSGVYLSPPKLSIFGLAYNWITNAWLSFRQNHVLIGGFSAYERKVFVSSGGFNEELSGSAEEIDLNIYLTSLGHQLLCVNHVFVEHHFTGGIYKFFLRAFSFGRIRYSMPQASLFNAPAAVWSGLISSGLFASHYSWLKLPIVFLLFVAFYLATLMGRLTSLVQGIPIYQRPQISNF